MLFSSYVSAIGQVQAGKLRVLGWTATKRSPTLPDVPTMAEAGFPGTELEIWQGIVAPLGTPAAIVKLNEEFIKAAQAPDVVSKVAAQAVEITTSTPEEFAKLIASDVERLGKVIRDAGSRRSRRRQAAGSQTAAVRAKRNEAALLYKRKGTSMMAGRRTR